MPLALSALADLLEAPFSEVAGDLPESQRRALLVALGLEDPPEQSSDPPEQTSDPLSLSRGTLEVFRALSVRAPLVVAIDDVQWLDAASQRVLAFAARRLADAPVALLATLRTESGNADPLALAGAFEPDAYTEIELRGLTPGAIQHLVQSRLGLDSRGLCSRGSSRVQKGIRCSRSTSAGAHGPAAARARRCLYRILCGSSCVHGSQRCRTS